MISFNIIDDPFSQGNQINYKRFEVYVVKEINIIFKSFN